MKPWHWRIAIRSDHFTQFAHLNDPVIMMGSCRTREECEKKVNCIPYAKINVNIWYNQNEKVPEKSIYPTM